MDDQNQPNPPQNYSVGVTPPHQPNPEGERARAEQARRKFFIGVGIAVVLGILLVGGAVFYFFYALGSAFSTSMTNLPGQTSYNTGANTALIEITGFMSCGSMGGTSAESVVQYIHEITQDSDIKVILLRLDTPGGTIASAQEIYAELLKAKKAGKKIVASMGDAAASGGYYVACPADIIIANPGTATGSIGVIMETFSAAELLDKVGVEFNTIKSGKFKDFGNYARPMTDEERTLAKIEIMQLYEQFVKVVSDSRKMPLDKVRKLADGRVYSGEQALKVGLIDKLGNYRDAYDACKELGGFEKVIIDRMRPQMPFERFIEMFAESSTRGALQAIMESDAEARLRR